MKAICEEEAHTTTHTKPENNCSRRSDQPRKTRKTLIKTGKMNNVTLAVKY
jgi:hypothetical protein